MTGPTSASLALLALAGVAAAVDWWAVAGGDRRRRVLYVAKPATLAALVAVAATIATPFPTSRAWFLPALALCLAGDVLLMLPGEKTAAFAGGLAAFLAGHVLFLVGLAAGGRARLPAALVAAGVIAVLAAAPLAAVLRGVARHLGRGMLAPVAVYAAALTAMAAAAWSAAVAGGGAAAPLLAAGGSLFVLSDGLLSFDRFVRRLPRGGLLVHVTYHLAVAGLVLSLAYR